MSKSIKIIFVIMMLVISVVGYDKFAEYRNHRQTIKLQKEKQSKDHFDKWLNEVNYRKSAVLLSIKYSTEEAKLFNMLIELESLKDGKVDSLENASDITRQSMDALSIKHSIPITVLANILIDYYHIKGAEASENSVQ